MSFNVEQTAAAMAGAAIDVLRGDLGDEGRRAQMRSVFEVTLKRIRIAVDGFIAGDFGDREDESAQDELLAWIRASIQLMMENFKRIYETIKIAVRKAWDAAMAVLEGAIETAIGAVVPFDLPRLPGLA